MEVCEAKRIQFLRECINVGSLDLRTKAATVTEAQVVGNND